MGNINWPCQHDIEEYTHGLIMQNFLVSRNRNSSRPGSFCWGNEWQKIQKKCSLPGSNWRPSDYETDALPTEPKELTNSPSLTCFTSTISAILFVFYFYFFPHTHTTSHNFTLHTTPLCTSPKKLKTILHAFFASATFYQLYNCTIIIASTIHSTQIFHMRQYASSSIFRLIFFRWSTSSFEHRAQAKSIS